MRGSLFFRAVIVHPAITLAACCVLAMPATAQFGTSNYVFTEKSSVLMLQPLRVSDNTASFTWSPDSVRLITFNIKPFDMRAALDHLDMIDKLDHSPPESSFSIGRWNHTSNFSDVVWERRFGTEPYLSGEPVWIPHTQSLAQVIFWQEKETIPNEQGKPFTQLIPNQELLWIDAARSTVREIHMAAGDTLSVSPNHSLAVMISQPMANETRPIEVTPIKLDGMLGTPFYFMAHVGIRGVRWTDDGTKLILTLLELQPDKKSVATTYVTFDPATSETKTLPVKPTSAPIPARVIAHEISLKPTVEHVRVAESDAVIHPLWAESAIKSEKSRMLVCGDADLGVISPSGASVAYRAHGSSWVSELKPVPLAMFKQMIANAKRVVAISNGKQLALAALMWAQDHDENLPGPDDINTELGPYTANESLFDGFTYTYTGGPLSGINSPAETELGTVDGPGGQAVMYADGHVKWRNR